MEADSYRNLTFSGSGDYALSITLKVFFSARSVDANVRFDDGYNFLTGLVADGNPAAQQFTDPRAGRTGTKNQGVRRHLCENLCDPKRR